MGKLYNKSAISEHDLILGSGSQNTDKKITEVFHSKGSHHSLFTTATHQAMQLLTVDFAVLSVVNNNQESIKSIVGFSQTTHDEYEKISAELKKFTHYIINSNQVLAIANLAEDNLFNESDLLKNYNVHSYLGVPLLTKGNDCLGTLVVMNRQIHEFTTKEINILQLISRWVVSEFERDILLKAQFSASSVDTVKLNQSIVSGNVKSQLLDNMTQQMRTPLTAIMGMTSVLQREIYGELIPKQKDYLQRIYQSGQQLLNLVAEIGHLGNINLLNYNLNLKSVDVDMLCQQVIQSLEHIAQQKQQKIELKNLEGNRIWLLDRTLVRQIIYYMTNSLLYNFRPEAVIYIDIYSESNQLKIKIFGNSLDLNSGCLYNQDLVNTNQPESLSSLSLLLSETLAKIHEGSIELSTHSNYGYILNLPLLLSIDHSF